MRLDYTSKKLSEAVYVLVGSGPVQDRLIGAYLHLIMITDKDLASVNTIVRDGFAELKRHLTSGTPVDDEGTVAASVAKLTDEEASRFARFIFEMYESVMQTGRTL